jgi:hypothetical protein
MTGVREAERGRELLELADDILDAFDLYESVEEWDELEAADARFVAAIAAYRTARRGS